MCLHTLIAGTNDDVRTGAAMTDIANHATAGAAHTATPVNTPKPVDRCPPVVPPTPVPVTPDTPAADPEARQDSSQDIVAQTLDFIGIDTEAGESDRDTEEEVYPCISCFARLKEQPPFQPRQQQCVLCHESLLPSTFGYVVVEKNLRSKLGMEKLKFENMSPEGKGVY